jgi:hypothetical protein
MDFIELYNLKLDTQHIKDVQDASLHKKNFGLKIEKGLLFGTQEWFDALDTGKIKIIKLRGTITNIEMVGDHNETREFELTNEEDGKKSKWKARGKAKYYSVGKRVELDYVTQRLKKPMLMPKEYVPVLLTLKVEL